VLASLLSLIPIAAYAQGLAEKINNYIHPVVTTNNFSGQVLVSLKGEIIFSECYGLADRERDVKVSDQTIFQIASVSKSFTAAAIMKLYQNELLHPEQPITEFITDYPRGNEITIHQLLTHTSGIPNINQMEVYDSLERHPQTPASLVSFLKNEPLVFQPGERYSYSNSNYNLLAYIIEQVSGQSFGNYLKQEFFDPLSLMNTGHPQKTDSKINHAGGYAPTGTDQVEPARNIHWSVKTGNGSLYATAHDLHKWSTVFFDGKLFPDSIKHLMLTDHGENVGYGWFIRPRHDRQQYHINGRSPGFSSVISYFPEEKLHIIILSNNYVPLATTMCIDISAMVFDASYQPLIDGSGRISNALGLRLTGRYQFGPDFYQPNVVLNVTHKDGYLSIEWGVLYYRGGASFINRDYWSDVIFKQNEQGVMIMDYDGHKGKKIDPK